MNRNKVGSSAFIVRILVTDTTLATTLQDVRLELARKETRELASGHTPRHKVSMMGFFSMGFDIEDQQ